MTGVIILAAGQSSRMGKAKQLLPYKGTSLLSNAISAAVESNAGVVVVVLGYEAEAIKQEVYKPGVVYAVNSNWREGMGSSIKAGITELAKHTTTIDGTVIMLCDQPMVTTALINQLMATKELCNTGMVACRYNDTVGVPAFFDRYSFSALSNLQGDSGAKKILLQFEHDVTFIDFPGGNIDVDTPEDFQKIS